MSLLLAKGAEACLYLEEWYGYQVIRKHRIPKAYRITKLDETLRQQRTLHEARLLSAARRAGVHTPIVFNIDPLHTTIIMEYIEGPQLRELLPSLNSTKRHRLFHDIGQTVAHLHQHHICHGDLTTSNLLLHPSETIYFVDFGLATTTQSIEDFGTDLHLLRRALLSTHYHYWKSCFDAFKKGYQESYGDDATAILQKVEAIESRGRYISERLG